MICWRRRFAGFLALLTVGLLSGSDCGLRIGAGPRRTNRIGRNPACGFDR